MANLSDICVTLLSSSLRRTSCTTHSLEIASLDLELFTQPPGNRLIYEVFEVDYE
jgi:hypothetical protein